MHGTCIHRFLPSFCFCPRFVAFVVSFIFCFGLFGCACGFHCSGLAWFIVHVFMCFVREHPFASVGQVQCFHVVVYDVQWGSTR